MKKFYLLICAVLLLTLAGCRKEDITPTATATLEGAAAGTPTALQLADLATDPAAFENRRVQTGGQYSVLPRPPCDAVLYLSPATWALSDGGVVIQAAGLENALGPLAPEGLVLTVEGQWRRWEGPIGCGDSAVVSAIWYLQAGRIISPNPLSHATLTPAGAEQEEPTGPTLAPSLTPTPGGAPGAPTPSRSATPTPTPTATATILGTLRPSPTNPSSPLATPTRSPTGSVFPSATPTPSPTGGVSPSATSAYSPTVTSLPTFTPIASDTPSPSPTASATPTGGTIEQEEIELDEVMNGTLLTDEIHLWRFDASAGDVITITTAPAAGLDLSLTLRYPAGSETKRDNGSAGEAETIRVELTETGEYQALVKGVDGAAGDYALVVLDEDSTPIVFPGNLSYGATISRSLPAETYHIWHFQGTADDNIAIRLTPNDGSDLIFEFYGPDMENWIERRDSSGEGDPEEASYSLAETGFYSIKVEVYGGVAASYQLEVWSRKKE